MGHSATSTLTITAILALLSFPCTNRAGDFRVRTATYLGGPAAAEEWNAVDVAPDGNIVLAGRLVDRDPGGVKANWLMAGGDGVVLRIAPDGTNVLSVTRIGDYVDDMQVGEDGRIAIAGSFGIAILATNGSQLIWRDGDVIRGTKAAAFRNQTPPFREDRYRKRVSRVAVGSDGTVASFQAEEKAWGNAPKKGLLYVWDRDGRRVSETTMVGYKYPKDLVVCSEQKTVIVGGFNTYSADSQHMKNHPIHMPFIVAYTYDGKEKWETYNFPAADSYKQNLFADSRVQRLNIGRDGMLYMGGYIHGGDYVWKMDPHDFTKRVAADVGYDSHSTAGHMGRGIDHAYFAKYDPANGDMLLGQPLICRRNADGSGKPSQSQIRGIHADEKGNVYISGYCEKYISKRDACTVNGMAVAAYHKPETFLMVVSPDFRKRHVWTVFSDEQSESASWGISVRGSTAALVSEVYEGRMLVTPNAMEREPMKTVDGYLVVWEPDS